MLCPTCGNMLEQDAKICDVCGTNLMEMEDDSAQSNTVQDNDIPSNDALLALFFDETENLDSIVSEYELAEQTDAVHQGTRERLFLDDEDEDDAESDEAIVEQFFSNLEAIEDDSDMQITNEGPIASVNRTIAPVFEAIPDEPQPENIDNTENPTETEMSIENTPEKADNDYDDYSDIVIGSGAPTTPNKVKHEKKDKKKKKEKTKGAKPVEQENATENVSVSKENDTVANEQTPQESHNMPPIQPSEVNNIPHENPVPFPELMPEENIDDNEPHILIDERPDFEQKDTLNAFVDIKINPLTASQTPYLDSFINRPQINVDFETPCMDDEENVATNITIETISDAPANDTTNDTILEKSNEETLEPACETVVPIMGEEENIANENHEQVHDNSTPVDATIPENTETTDIENKTTEKAEIIEHDTPSAENNNDENKQEKDAGNTDDKENNLPPAIANSTSETDVDKVSSKSKTKYGATIKLLSVTAVLLSIALIFGIFTSIVSLSNNQKTDDVAQTPTTNITIPENTEPTTLPTEETEPTIDETEPTVPTPENPSNNPMWELKQESSVDAPLYVGDAAVVSRYLDDTQVFAPLQIKLSKIYRGESATKIAEEYEENSTVRFEKPAEGVEYAVIEYQIYTPAEIDTVETKVNVPLEVRGQKTTGVIHNNMSYVISTWTLEDGGSTSKDSVVTCREIFQIPIGCSDYYLVFGTESETTVTYKGE